MSWLFLALMAALAPAGSNEPESLPTEAFDAPKYGVATRIPAAGHWRCGRRTTRSSWRRSPRTTRPGPGPRPASWAWPETLDDYRTRIDASARQRGRPSGKLASNRLIKDDRGERLETVWEFHPSSGGFWHEVTVRVIAHRQLYSFILNVEDARYAATRPAFDALVAAAKFTPPNTGADLLCQGGQPVGPARVQVRPRFADGMEPGPRPQRGCAPLRQRPGPRRLVRQRPGAGPPAGQRERERAGQGAPGPAQARRPELRDRLVQGDHAGSRRGPGDRRPHPARAVLHDGHRAEVPGQPLRLRGQVHPGIQPIRHDGPDPPQEPGQLPRAARPPGGGAGRQPGSSSHVHECPMPAEACP